MASQDRLKTKFLIVSDTHSQEFPADLKPLEPVDVAIHCGDLTNGSKLEEFRTTLRLIKDLNAPLKLVIAGNHDFTMDTPIFEGKIKEAGLTLEDDAVKREYGVVGEAKELFYDAKDDGIVFLDEGTHRFMLANGASMAVYASPYTPSSADWGFVYPRNQDHRWEIDPETDIVITHGPPHGILDLNDRGQRSGSTCLFAAVARAKPLLHCFGHIHDGWGARLVSWRDPISEKPSHFTDIDNDKSVVLEKLGNLHPRKFDTPERASEKREKLRNYQLQRYCGTSHCHDDTYPLQHGTQTLFVNAAIPGHEDDSFNLPWLVAIELPRASTED